MNRIMMMTQSKDKELRALAVISILSNYEREDWDAFLPTKYVYGLVPLDDMFSYKGYFIFLVYWFPNTYTIVKENSTEGDLALKHLTDINMQGFRPKRSLIKL